MPDLKLLWKKVENIFYENIIHSLRKTNLIPPKEVSAIFFKPDFEDEEAWKITTIETRNYTSLSSVKETEEIVAIEGRLFLGNIGGIVRPSIGFTWNAEDRKFKMDRNKFVELVKKSRERVNEQLIVDVQEIYKNASPTARKALTKAKGLEVYSAGHSAAIKAIKSDLTSTLKNLGFSEEERNIMVLGALNHEKFTESSTLEDAVTLALQLRNK